MIDILLKKIMSVMLFVLLSMTTAANAQIDSVGNVNDDVRGCQSTWTSYNYLKESSSLVRSNDRNYVVHTQHKNNSTGMLEHIFIVKTSPYGAETAFSTYFNAVDSTTYHVNITDMRLFEDTCYFCGTIVYTYVDYTGAYVTNGFVGRFVPQKMQNGTDSMTYHIVKEASDLSRLAISKASGYNVLISALGHTTKSGNACIVELTPITAPADWELHLDTLEALEDVEFTDIMTVYDSLTLLSQFKCANNYPYGNSYYDNSHQVFLLDRFGANGCRASYSSYSIHYMAHYEMLIGENCSFHYSKAPMRLCHINDQYRQFGVSFGVQETNLNLGGIRLFPFQHMWKYDSCIYYQLGRHVEIKEIGNLYKTATLFVLSHDYTHPSDIVTLPELGSAAHGVTQLDTSSFTLNSLTQKFIGNHIDISGRDNSSVFHLFDQDVTMLLQPTCFKRNHYQYNVLPGKNAARLVAKWGFSDPVKFRWVKANVFETNSEKETVCAKCM